jgi:hypothetical protein
MIASAAFSKIFVNWHMTHAELQRRNQLIAFIEQVQDENLIDEMLRMMKQRFESNVYVASSVEKAAIQEAQIEIAEGKGIPAEDVEREMEEWLAD